MTQPQINSMKQRILDELDVMEDDIHVSKDKDALTFYLPPEQIEQAEEILDTEVKVLEEHEHEYLVKTSI